MSPFVSWVRTGRANAGLDSLDVPAFLRRQDEEETWGELFSITPHSEPSALPWPDRLDALLNEPTVNVAALIVEIRNGLVQLETLGKVAAALITEGWDLIDLLDSDHDAARKRLVDWLRRVRKRLERPVAGRWRRLWWRNWG